LILKNARIYTQNPKQPFVRALATRGERIVSVGSNEEVASASDDDPQIIDLQGETVLPGFIDCHLHFLWGGLSLLRPSFRSVKSAGQMARKISEAAPDLSPGEWLIGEDWDPNAGDDECAPSLATIDRITPHTPVFIRQMDGHSALVNTVALNRAGIGKGTPDPPGGEIGRHPRTGELTGHVRDAAMDLVYQHVPPAGEGQREKAIRRASAEALRLGVTSVHDMGSIEDAALYQRMLERGEIRTRITVYCPVAELEDRTESVEALLQSPRWIRLGGFKAFVDGSLGSRTALLSEPYLDRPETCGIYDGSAIPLDRFEDRLRQADRTGFQLAVHAIGDRAVHELLDIFYRLAERNPPRDRRFRVEHAQHLLPDDFHRFARLGVIASVQPYHLADDGRWAEKALGRKRCRYAYAFRSFLDAGVCVAFGSDWPVAPLNPLAAVRAAVTRRTSDGKNPGGWFPEQRIGVVDAVKAFTTDAAYAEFAEHEKGSLEPGKLADLVVLSHDIMTDPAALSDAKVEMTMVGGRMTLLGNGG
jgi:predicted amidohydrolase YtcJ